MSKSSGTELSRRRLLQMGVTATAATLLAGGAEFALPPEAHALGDPLPSWNDGPAKKAILDFIHVTTDKSSSKFVPPEQRIATFDQDGTLWVEHPLYSQVVYCFDRVPAVVKAKPELANVEPFKTVLTGDREAIAKLPMDQLMKILAVTLTGMSVDAFEAQANEWLGSARDPRWKKLYMELTYQPMLEVLKHLRSSDYKTYIVTGGGQDFVRTYAERVYGIPPEQVVGTMGGTTFGYDKSGKPFLTKDPKLLLNDNNAGKPEGIHLMIGGSLMWLSATRREIGRCWNTPRPEPASGCRCSCCTMTHSASMPTGPRKACRIPKSAHSRRHSTTKPNRRAGLLSA
jgi:phosphoglycolate phosphatase-like HAD superfamily hydrolase